MQLNVFWGIGGEEIGGVRISTPGKKVMKCTLTAMISISSVSMPYSLCYTPYNLSLLALLHRAGCTGLLASWSFGWITQQMKLRRNLGAIKHWAFEIVLTVLCSSLHSPFLEQVVQFPLNRASPTATGSPPGWCRGQPLPAHETLAKSLERVWYLWSLWYDTRAVMGCTLHKHYYEHSHSSLLPSTPCAALH